MRHRFTPVLWFGLILGAVFGCLVTPTVARAEVTLTALADYFDALKTVRSVFTQIGPDGRRAQGLFHYRQPGLMRFDFNAPSKQVMIAGETWLSLQDAPGAEANRYPVRSSPLGRFIQSRERLDHTGFFQKMAVFVDQAIVVLRDPNAPDDGTLELVFGLPEIELIGWRIRDTQNQTTEIILSDISHPQGLPMRLFVPSENLDDDY